MKALRLLSFGSNLLFKKCNRFELFLTSDLSIFKGNSAGFSIEYVNKV